MCRGEPLLQPSCMKCSRTNLGRLRRAPMQGRRRDRRRSMFNSPSARPRRSQRHFARRIPDDQLAEQGVVERRNRIAGIKHRIEARAHAAGNLQRGRPCRATGRNSCAVLRIDANLDGVSADARRRFAGSASGSPPAMSIISRTRSIPVIISVTGCSTWMRVFISMK